MNDKNTLAEEIFRIDNCAAPDHVLDEGWERLSLESPDTTYAHHIAEGLLQRGWRKHTLITDREGLKTLPDGALLLSHSPWKSHAATVWEHRGGFLHRVGREKEGVTPIAYFVDPLPVMVIHTPEEN